MRRPGRPTGRSVLVASVLAAAALSATAMPRGPGARAAEPPVVAAHVHVDNYRNAVFTGVWSLPAGAEAVLCYSSGGTPTSPDTSQACSYPDAYRGRLAGVSPRSPVDPPEAPEHFAVFARAAPTAPWGPPALDRGGALPPFPAAALRTTGVSGSALVLAWEDASTTYGSDYEGRGGTTRWVVAWARGGRPPEALARSEVTTTSVEALEHRADLGAGTWPGLLVPGAGP